MSALGHKRTFCGAKAMSALPPIADIRSAKTNVCFVPLADLRPCRIGDIVRYDLRSHEVVVAR